MGHGMGDSLCAVCGGIFCLGLLRRVALGLCVLCYHVWAHVDGLMHAQFVYAEASYTCISLAPVSGPPPVATRCVPHLHRACCPTPYRHVCRKQQQERIATAGRFGVSMALCP